MKLITLERDSNIKINNDITYYLNPDYIYIPIGEVWIDNMEFIYKNALIIDSYKSPISGYIANIKDNYLVIKNDFRELEKRERKRKKKITITNILECLDKNKENLLDRFKNQTKFSNIVITALNDDAYIYNNIFVLKENITELLELIDELSYLYKTDNNYLVVKNIDTMIINECLNAIGTYPNIKLTLVNDEYLLERKEFLETKLPIKDNTLYLSTTELLRLNNYLLDKDTSTTILTISGSALKESKVIRVKKYTLLSDILDNYFIFNTDEFEVIANGLMQGFLVTDVKTFVITDDIYAINVMKCSNNQVSSCINCGKCIEICPVGVNPLSGKNIKNCINCGLCSYICPAFVNLKEKLKEYQNDER